MMKKMITVASTALLLLGTYGVCKAQDWPSNEAEYQRMKEAGTLPERPPYDPTGVKPIRPVIHPTGTPKAGSGNCDCWIEPDGSYTLAMPPNDDASSPLISIPFQFNLYGDLYSTLYINNNGNVSFDSPWGTFTATGFPTSSFAMVAPFWGDVDTRGIGEVWYKVTQTAVYVNWVDVGYYSQYTDKVNNFQLILSDGNDPVIGIGNNVSFCYQDMQWTTGDASSGTNGFGGSPAVVGANRGNGVDYIQFGTFDQPGNAYDGPFGNPDGIDWLDNKDFKLTTAVSTSNIPPIPNSLYLCDTLTACVGELVNIQMDFIAPEQNQTTTATSSSALTNYQEISNTSGINATIESQFTPTAADVGFQIITYTAMDNGTPSLTSLVNIVVEVVPAPSAPPTITGDSLACPGEFVTVMADTGFTGYTWSSGAIGNPVDLGPGTYTVTVGSGACLLTSPPFTITEVVLTPTITGAAVNCGGQPSTLMTDTTYAQYQWFDGGTNLIDTTATIDVGTGDYTVTVTDENGCSATSPLVTVLSAPDPGAFFDVLPGNSVILGNGVQLVDGSTGNGGNIVSQSYQIGDSTIVGTDTVPYLFQDLGLHTVTLTVTTADGCTDSYTVEIQVLPNEVIIPNVFSPNADGYNDQLQITGIEGYPNNMVRVYNRWGQMVFEKSNYRNTWRAPGLSEGTYYLIVDLGNGEIHTGHLTLVR